MKRTRLLVPLVILAALPGTATASTPDETIRPLAQNQTHSWTQDHLTFQEMVDRYKAGHRLYVTCGNVAEVARRLLRQAGHPARVVQVLTLGEWDYLSDGHLMTEVWFDGHWQLYDLDANVRAVNTAGAGVSVVEQVQAVRDGTAVWETIADDPLYLETEPNLMLRDLARDIFTDPAAFYWDVMGIPLLPRDPEGTVNLGMFFNDESQVERLGNYRHGWRFFAGGETWAQLTQTDTAPALPVTAPPRVAPVVTIPVAPPTPAPAPVIAAPTPPAPAPVATAACLLRGQAITVRGTVTCRHARRVLGAFYRTGRDPRGWDCHSRRRSTCMRRTVRISVALAAQTR